MTSTTLPLPVTANTEAEKQIFSNIEAANPEVPTPHNINLRRSTREKKCPRKLDDYELLFSLCSDQAEPQTFKQACSDINSVFWMDAMRDEIDSLNSNQTWYLVPLPANRKALKNKWVYRIKEEDGGQKRYKARLVVKGFAQK
jgi:ATP-binding cassette subfamily B (MDR/TAP) protein 1